VIYPAACPCEKQVKNPETRGEAEISPLLNFRTSSLGLTFSEPAPGANQPALRCV
jgi:hypothetical protein